MEAGLNLYTLRSHIKTEADFLTTATALRDMGYTTLQYSGGPYDPEVIKRVSRKTGLPIVLTHMPMDRILNDTDKLMAEHERFGCRYIGLGAMSADIITDRDRCLQTIDALEAAAERMEENGFAFFYHNHHFEFYRHGKQTVFDMLIEQAPHVRFTVDTYWLQFGGADILSFLQRLPGRIQCVHLKDYLVDTVANAPMGLMPRFAPVGDGSLNFPAIVKTARAMGAEYFLVEQDNAPDFPDPLEQVRRSIDYIKKEL